jgi:hypothetical protein
VYTLLQKKMARKKNSMTALWVVLLLIVAVVGLIGGKTFFSADDSGSGTSTALDGTKIICGGDVTPDLLIRAIDKENPNTAIAGNFIYRQKGTTAWTTGTLGTELTGLIVGAEYEFVAGINTTTETDMPYGEKFNYVVKCVEDDTIEIEMYNDEIETSLSATFYNKDANAQAQTFTAGDEYVVSLRLKAGSDEVFGNPFLSNPNVLVLKLNKSEWEVPNSVYLADGTELKRASTPLRYDQQASGFTEYAYELPAILDKEVSIFLGLVADDTNAPSVDGTAYIYAGGYFVEKSGSISIGVEDENGNAVATDAPDSVALDFTA